MIVITLVSIFVILLVLYRVFEDKIFLSLVERCDSSEVCVRFCCTNKVSCENDSHFDVSEWMQATNLQKDFKIIKGKPCKEGYTGNAPWSFLKVQNNRRKILTPQ